MQTEKYDEAEEMYRRCLKISLKEHEEEHADTATALNNLAGVLEKTSRFAEAEELYIRALVIMEKTNGAEHGDTATLLHNIAVVLKMQVGWLLSHGARLWGDEGRGAGWGGGGGREKET